MASQSMKGLQDSVHMGFILTGSILLFGFLGFVLGRELGGGNGAIIGFSGGGVIGLIYGTYTLIKRFGNGE